LYINLVDGRYNGHREKITGVASAQAKKMGKKEPFGPLWQFIRHVSIAHILGLGMMDPELSAWK